VFFSTGPPEKPINFHYRTVTAKSVTLVWTSGQSGGYLQSFSLESHSSDANQFILIAHSIPDPGLGEEVVYKAVDLQPSTTYLFRIAAVNIHNGGSSILGDVIKVNTYGNLIF
jgi:hypothetical protein